MARKSILTAQRLVAMRRAGSSPEELKAYADAQNFGGWHVSGAVKTAAKVAAAVALPAAGAGALGIVSRLAPGLASSPDLGPALPALLPQAQRPSSMSTLGKITGALSTVLSGGAGSNLAAGSCPPGSRRIPPFIGPCVNTPGGPVTGGGVILSQGEAVMARYGAALVPQSEAVTVRRCPRGAVLAKDGYCYNKSQLRRGDRMWVPGRKPLLTGGEMNALTVAARVTSRIEAKTKALQRMGLMKKPHTGRRGSSRSSASSARGPITVIDT